MVKVEFWNKLNCTTGHVVFLPRIGEDVIIDGGTFKVASIEHEIFKDRQIVRVFLT